MDSQKPMLNLQLDAESDVLYISFGEPREAISVERDNGVIERLDPETDETVGLTILNFMSKARENHSPSYSLE